MNFFDIGIVVKHIINSIPNGELPSGFKGKVFPLIAPVGTLFPFCIYRRTSGRYEYDDKDYGTNETVSIQLKVVTTTYQESIELISKISDAFINFRNIFIGRDNTELAQIDNIRITDSNEEFIDDSFIQTIYLEFTYK